MEQLEYPMIDMDHEIEAAEGREISTIFATDGEAYFREVESNILKRLTNENDHVIISTGGGAPCFHDGISYMKEHGVVVFLQTAKEVLIERLSRKDHRPLVQNDVENRVNELLEKRLPIYEQAHVSIDHRDVDLFMQQVAAV